MQFVYDDGGRSSAGYHGATGDCVCRSIAIVAQLPYQQVYDLLAKGNAEQRLTKHSRNRSAAGVRTAAHGISTRRKWFRDLMVDLGFHWTPTMFVGQGCKVHLSDGELPMGRLVVALSRHYTAVINGVIHDTYSPERGATEWIEHGPGDARRVIQVGGRCVYGYWAGLDELS